MRYSATYLVLSIGALIFVIPLIWLLATSFMGPYQNPFSIPPQIIPRPFTLDNYKTVFQNYNFGMYLWNSVKLAVLSVFSNIIVTVITAYPLARLKFRGKKVIMGLIIATLVLPAEGTLIPTYLMVAHLHMANSYLGIIVPGLFSAFNVFLLRQAYMQLSSELEDAARIDGASDLRIFLQIMTPLVLPSLATVMIMGFLGSWDSFLWPLIILNSQNLYTAPLGLSYFAGQFGASWQIVAAASVVVAAPVVLFFLVLQRFFVNGVSGAFKG